MSVGTLIKYGAVTAKARAMFGNRLKDEDYRTIAALRSLPEVNSYIKYKTSYGALLENEDEKELHRERLEKLLKRQLDSDCKRLSNFIQTDKKKSLDMYRMQREINFILSVLRGLRNGTAERRTEFIGSVLADGDDRLDPTIVDLLSREYYRGISRSARRDALRGGVEEGKRSRALIMRRSKRF